MGMVVMVLMVVMAVRVMGMTVKLVTNDEGESDDNSDNSGGLPEYTQLHSDITNEALIYFFLLFIADSLLEVIIDQTIFAQQYMKGHELSHCTRVQHCVQYIH